MAFKPYNNNEKNLTCSTFSNISFSNPESNIAQTKISIGYFNKVMKISIAARNNNGSNDNFATYDNDNAVSVYVSNIKARILYLLIQKLISDPDTHNVCVELMNTVHHLTVFLFLMQEKMVLLMRLYIRQRVVSIQEL